MDLIKIAIRISTDWDEEFEEREQALYDEEQEELSKIPFYKRKKPWDRREMLEKRQKFIDYITENNLTESEIKKFFKSNKVNGLEQRLIRKELNKSGKSGKSP